MYEFEFKISPLDPRDIKAFKALVFWQCDNGFRGCTATDGFHLFLEDIGDVERLLNDLRSGKAEAMGYGDLSESAISVLRILEASRGEDS